MGQYSCAERRPVRPPLLTACTSFLLSFTSRFIPLAPADVKAQNVLLRSCSPRDDPRGFKAKLSDFGCVKLLEEQPPAGTYVAGAELRSLASRRCGDVGEGTREREGVKAEVWVKGAYCDGGTYRGSAVDASSSNLF